MVNRIIAAVTAPVNVESLPTLLEIKTTLDGRRKEFRCRLLEREPDSAVVLFVSDRAYQVADLALPAGTITFGHFWTLRPYNAYHWLSPEGATLAHYYNLATSTEIEDATLRWRDLAIDVLVRPGAPAEILDEHEVPATIDPSVRAVIDAASRATLSDLASTGRALETAADRLWLTLFGRPRR